MIVTDQEFTEIVSNSRSVRQVLQVMGLKAAGGNYKTIKQRIFRLHIDISHFLGGFLVNYIVFVL